MYAPKTLPAIVANPAVMTAWSSDLVMCGKYGRTSSGDSVWKQESDEIKCCLINLKRESNLLRTPFSKAVISKWSTDQPRQHHLGTCSICSDLLNQKLWEQDQ